MRWQRLWLVAVGTGAFTIGMLLGAITYVPVFPDSLGTPFTPTPTVTKSRAVQGQTATTPATGQQRPVHKAKTKTYVKERKSQSKNTRAPEQQKQRVFEMRLEED